MLKDDKNCTQSFKKDFAEAISQAIQKDKVKTELDLDYEILQFLIKNGINQYFIEIFVVENEILKKKILKKISSPSPYFERCSLEFKVDKIHIWFDNLRNGMWCDVRNNINSSKFIPNVKQLTVMITD